MTAGQDLRHKQEASEKPQSKVGPALLLRCGDAVQNGYSAREKAGGAPPAKPYSVATTRSQKV